MMDGMPEFAGIFPLTPIKRGRLMVVNFCPFAPGTHPITSRLLSKEETESAALVALGGDYCGAVFNGRARFILCF